MYHQLVTKWAVDSSFIKLQKIYDFLGLINTCYKGEKVDVTPVDRHTQVEQHFAKAESVKNQDGLVQNKLAKLRKHASRVHFSKIHFGKIFFIKIFFDNPLSLSCD